MNRNQYNRRLAEQRAHAIAKDLFGWESLQTTSISAFVQPPPSIKILDIPSSCKLGLQVRQNVRYGQIAIKMACDGDPTVKRGIDLES